MMKAESIAECMGQLNKFSLDQNSIDVISVVIRKKKEEDINLFNSCLDIVSEYDKLIHFDRELLGNLLKNLVVNKQIRISDDIRTIIEAFEINPQKVITLVSSNDENLLMHCFNIKGNMIFQKFHAILDDLVKKGYTEDEILKINKGLSFLLRQNTTVNAINETFSSLKSALNSSEILKKPQTYGIQNSEVIISLEQLM